MNRRAIAARSAGRPSRSYPWPEGGRPGPRRPVPPPRAARSPGRRGRRARGRRGCGRRGGEGRTHAGGRDPGRQLRPAACAASAVQDPGLPQHLVGGGDRRPADVEGRSELPLRGHAHLQRQPPVEHQQADPVGERRGQPAPSGWPPIAEQSGEAAGTDAAVDSSAMRFIVAVCGPLSRNWLYRTRPVESMLRHVDTSLWLLPALLIAIASRHPDTAWTRATAMTGIVASVRPTHRRRWPPGAGPPRPRISPHSPGWSAGPRRAAGSASATEPAGRHRD